MPTSLHDTILSENPLPEDAETLFVYFGSAPKYGFPLAINVSSANAHDSKGIVPVLHQLAGRGFKGTALGAISAIGASGCPRPAKRLASPSNPAPAVMAEPSFRRVFGGSSSAPWHGLVATVG